MRFSSRNLAKVLSALCLLQGSNVASAAVIVPEIPPDLVPESPNGLPLPGLEGLEVEDIVPGSLITDVDTVETQVQPVVSGIQQHLRNVFRAFAAPQGGGASAEDGLAHSFWVNYNSTDFENTFSRTRFDGAGDLMMLGYDLAFAENHVLGVALGSEKTEIDTQFNNGGLETEGSTITPYYGWLFSDNWSVDLAFGRTDLDTDQFRVLPEGLGPLSGTRVTSSASAERSFTTVNLNGFWTIGDFSLGSRLGYLSTKNEQDAYTESDGSEVAAGSLELKQTQLGADIAYGGRSQPYLGLTLMKDSSSERLVFPSGEQPAADDESLQLAAGWRYYGESFSATLEWNKRDGKEQYEEDALWFMLRYSAQ